MLDSLKVFSISGDLKKNSLSNLKEEFSFLLLCKRYFKADSLVWRMISKGASSVRLITDFSSFWGLYGLSFVFKVLKNVR